MKDLHSHILYGIDDGSQTIEESIAILKESKKQGIDEIILTPHYIENSKYNCNNKNKEELFNKLKERVEEENIDIKIYLGNEVFFTDNFLSLLKQKEITTLNNSKYILFEFPMGPIYNNTSEIISILISKGYTPILAHPERYPRFQEHPELAEEYLRMGVHMQGNFTSLFGKYGRTSEKTLKYLLKKHYISFLGSDVHHEVNYSAKKLEKKLLRITKDKEYVADLMGNNFDKVINKEEIGILR
ncbi:MAG: capsular biosynthesis protein [Bacilli bacterium]|nr:capsular biosynthesis protein [Bacilli bacterium]